MFQAYFEEFKKDNTYLSTSYSKTFTNLFNKIHQKELFYKKPFLSFSDEQLYNTFFSILNSYNFRSVGSIYFAIGKFIKYINCKFEYNELFQNNLDKAFNDIKCEKEVSFNNQYIDKKNLYSLINGDLFLKNESYCLICLLLFEGIRGKGNEELSNLKKCDFDLYSNRVFISSRECFINLPADLCDMIKNSTTYNNLNDNSYIFSLRISEPLRYAAISSKLRYLTEITKDTRIKGNNVLSSGELYYLTLLEKYYCRNLSIDDFNIVLRRFGKKFIPTSASYFYLRNMYVNYKKFYYDSIVLPDDFERVLF